MSKTRKKYFIKLLKRILILILSIILAIYFPNNFSILNKSSFFTELSLFHILWLIWIIDIILQIIPIRNNLALGSKKLFFNYFTPTKTKTNYKALQKYIKTSTKSAYKVFIIWGLLIICIGLLYYNNTLNKKHLLLISILFYVCDLICILIWCPFRLIMKNKCCTTCRIFNWDHLMMFTPLIFINSFFTISLIIVSTLAFLEWELFIILHPERFWEITNTSLKCSNCTDKLCTQYCQKLRKKL